jgi:hypothetical protein
MKTIKLFITFIKKKFRGIELILLRDHDEHDGDQMMLEAHSQMYVNVKVQTKYF